MARDSTRQKVSRSLKDAGIKPLKLTKDIGKALLFDSLPNQFKGDLPNFESIYASTVESADSVREFSSGGSSALKSGINKMFNSESVQAVRSTASRLLKQVKSGSIYTPMSDDDIFGSLNDDLLDNFGGMQTAYTDEGDFIEYEDSSSQTDELELAKAKNKADDARTDATIRAIGHTADAQMQFSQALTQTSLQFQAKFHDESISMMRNQLTMSSAIYETMNNQLSSMNAMLQEANKSLVNDVKDIKSYLKTIVDERTTAKNNLKTKAFNVEENPFSYGFNIDEYKKIAKKNIENSPAGMAASMMSMLGLVGSMLTMDDRTAKNPILFLTDALASKIIPKTTHKKMKSTNEAFDAFLISLLAKWADDTDYGSIKGTIKRTLGYKAPMNKTIKTAKDLEYASQWSGKDSKALTDVIPTQLSKIISLMSGEPLRLFDYKSGKFVTASASVAKSLGSATEMGNYGGETMRKLRGRAEKIDFGSDARNAEFLAYLEEFFGRAMSGDTSINPYDKRNFDPSSKYDTDFQTALTGLIRSLSKNDMIRFGSEIQGSRTQRSHSTASLNTDLVQSSMIMAFSEIGMQGLDDDGRDLLLRRITAATERAGGTISSRQLLSMIRQSRQRAKNGADAATESTTILKDIRNILRRGVLTYSYGVSNGFDSTTVPPGFDDALKEARAARRTMNRSAKRYTAMSDDPNSRVGGVSISERNRIFGEILRRDVGEAKLKEYAEKLGYASSSELIAAAQKYNQTRVGGDSISFGSGTTATGIADILRGYDLDEIKRETVVDKVAGDKVKGLKGKFNSYKDRISKRFAMFQSPFKLIDYAMDTLDSAMFKILYGDIPEEDDKKRSEKSVMDIIRASIESQTNKFSTFLEDKFDFIDDKLFGEKGIFRRLADWAAGKLVGKRGEDGRFSGGKFSDFANKAIDLGKDGTANWVEAFKEEIFGHDYGNSKRVMGFDGQMKTKNVGRQGGLIQPLRDGIASLNRWLFGASDKMTDSKKIAGEIGKELKSAAPGMAAGAVVGGASWLGAGLLTGMFLPGGPLLAGILGSFGGLVKKSDKLREYLFGIDGGDGKKRGGLIPDNIQKGVKKFVPNIGKGALIGATLGNLGILPFGIGNLAGALFGSMGGLVAGSDQLKTMLFGDGVDPESGMINKKLRTKLMDIIPGWLMGKAAGNVVWNTITNLGLIPGLAMLPGGPVLGAIGGIVGAFSKEHIENFLFGKKDKDGKRDDSGIFSKMFNGVKDKLLSPITSKLEQIGDSIQDWFKEVVVENLKDFFSPVTELFKRGLNKMKKKSQDLSDIMRGAFSTVFDKYFGPLLDKWKDRLFGKKNEEGKRKGGIIRAVASAPFKALGRVGRAMTSAIGFSDDRFERKERRRYEKQLRKDIANGTAIFGDDGKYHLADEEAFARESQNRREKRGTGGNFWDSVNVFKERGKNKREKAEAKRKERKAKAANSEGAVETAAGTEEAIKSTGVDSNVVTIASNTGRTSTLLEAILRTMGGEVPEATCGSSETAKTSEKTSEATGGSGSSGKVSSAAAKATDAVGQAATTVAGDNQILKTLIGATVNGAKRLGSKISELTGGAVTFSDKDPRGKYLHDLYIRADRAMSASQNPQKTADEIIKNLPPEYAVEGIEVVNQVFELNHSDKNRIGGFDGKTTGLLETLKALAGMAANGIGSLMQTLTSLFSGGGFGLALPGPAVNVGAGAPGAAGGAVPLLTSGNPNVPFGPPKPKLRQFLGDGWKTKGVRGLFSGAKNWFKANGGLGGIGRNIAQSIIKNPKALAKGGLVAGGLLLGANALGNMVNGDEDKGFIGNTIDGVKTAVPTIAGGMLDWYTSSEGILNTISGITRNKINIPGVGTRVVSDVKDGLFSGIANLTPAEIANAAKGQLPEAGSGLSAMIKSKGASNVQRLVGGAKGFVSGAKATISDVANTGLAKGLSTVAKGVKDKIVSAASKFFGSAPVKAVMGAIGKQASKIPGAIGKVLDNFLVKALTDAAKNVGQQAAKLVAKAAATVSTGGLLLIAFSLADFISGMGDANKYFGVKESDDTMGMKVVSGVVKCLQGLISNLLASSGVGIIGSIAVSLLPTGAIAQMLYKLIVGADAERELYEKQGELEAECAKYNEEHGTNLTVAEYSEQVDSGSIKKTVGKIASTVKDGAVKLGTGIANAAKSAAGAVGDFLFGSNAKATESESEDGISGKVRKVGVTSASIRLMSTFISKGLGAIFSLKFVKDKIGNSGEKVIKVVTDALNRVAENLESMNIIQRIGSVALAGPKAIAAFYNGYRNPTKYIDIDGADIDGRTSIACGIGAAVASMTYGALQGSDVAKMVNSILHGEKVKEDTKKQVKVDAAAMNTSATISGYSSETAMMTDNRNDTGRDNGTDPNKPEKRSVWDRAKDGVKKAAAAIANFFKFGNGRGRYGRGEYFSQTDPIWNRYDPDMKNSGCGPTVAAMMASHYGRGRWGTSANPAEADMMSRNMPGMRDFDGGTNPEFFESYGASKGISMQAGMPSRGAMEQSLRSGNAVGLMGEGGPFGSNMHYMMADSIDSNGNAHVVDPYGGKEHTIPISQLSKDTDTAIYSGYCRGRWGRSVEPAPPENSQNAVKTKISGSVKTTQVPTTDPRGIVSKAAFERKRGINVGAGELSESEIDPAFIKNGKGRRRSGRGRWGRGGYPATANGMVYYSQCDDRWGSTVYTAIGDRSQTIATSGCGPTSMAMAMKSLGVNIDPSATAKFALKNGCRTANSGTSWDFFAKIASANGLEVSQTSSWDAVITALKAKKPVVASMGPGHFTGGGHFILLAGMSGDKVLVNDPNDWRGPMTKTNKQWSQSIVKGEAKQFWIVSKGGAGVSGAISGSGGIDQREAFVKTAEAEIGYKEKASNQSLDVKAANAGSANYSKYGAAFGSPCAAWCSYFVAWCAKESGCSSIIPQTGLASASADEMKAKNQWKDRNYKPQRGDLIYFNYGGSSIQHVGIVTACDGSTVKTVEGNYSDSVGTASYPVGDTQIAGYGTPAFSTTSGSTSATSSGSDQQYSGAFGAFQKVFDQISNTLTDAFAPITGQSSSASSGDGSTGDGSTSGGTLSGTSGSDSGGTLSGGSKYPTYKLTDAQKKFIAGVASAEQDSSDISAQRLEVSQMANLNDAERKKDATGDALMGTLKSGWYAKRSLNLANQGKYSQQALQAVDEVLVQGKRTLPRHVTEHDFYGDISNINLNPSTQAGKENRRKMKVGDTIKNTMGSTYQFYKFAGKNGAEGHGDPFGSKAHLIPKYQSDVPWGSGRGRGPSPDTIYRTGGMNDQIREINASMARVNSDKEFYRKTDAIDTQARAMSKAASGGGFGRGGDSVVAQQSAQALLTLVELVREIRDQGAAFQKLVTGSSDNAGKKTPNPYGSQVRMDQNDPGTRSMTKMAIRS